MHHTGHRGPFFHALYRHAGKKGSQGGVGRDEVVLLLLHHPAQSPGRLQVLRSQHFLSEGENFHFVSVRNHSLRAAAGYVDGPTMLTKGP